MQVNDRPEHDSSNEAGPQQFLFLAGTGRSGTSILRQSLGLHPEIYYNGHENNIVQDVIKVALRNCTLKSRAHSMVVSQSKYDAEFRNLLTSIIWPDSNLKKRPILMAAINPSKEILDYLLQVFPQAKIIGLVRNGIEVISSRMKYQSFAKGKFSQHCDVWLRSTGVINWGQNHPEQFRMFRHDWTYADCLESKFEELFRWIGISQCAAVFKNMTSVIVHPTSDTGKEFKSMTPEEKRKYFRSKADAWRAWAPEQRNLFHERCTGLMQKLDYPIPF